MNWFPILFYVSNFLIVVISLNLKNLFASSRIQIFTRWTFICFISSNIFLGQTNERVPYPPVDPFLLVIRSRLSYEQFSAFLANVKELNAHKQTKEVPWCLCPIFLSSFSTPFILLAMTTLISIFLKHYRRLYRRLMRFLAQKTRTSMLFLRD